MAIGTVADGVVTTTFDNQVTIAEDVQDKIWDISPTETPFGSSIGSNKAANVVHQWIEDELQPAGFQAVAQGSNAGDTEEHVGIRRTNNTQIFRGVVTVSETMQAVTQYGIKKMASYLAAKRTKEIKRDIEYTFLGNQAIAPGSPDDAATPNADEATATKMASAQYMIDAGNIDDNSSTPAPLTETMILNIMETVYTEGGYPKMLLCPPNQANVIAAFATASASGISRQLVNDISTLTAVVDVIRTPFGTLNVSLDRFMRTSDVFLIDTEFWYKSILRPSTLQPLAKTGSSVRMMIETELTLQGSAFKSSGLISFLS
jgi:hypothetical protein